MIATPQPDASAVFARSVLNMAAEVEAAESAIKQAILDAAHAGDCDRVIDIVTRWQALPACEVLAAKALATCSASEVGVSEDRRPPTPSPSAR